MLLDFKNINIITNCLSIYLKFLTKFTSIDNAHIVDFVSNIFDKNLISFLNKKNEKVSGLTIRIFLKLADLKDNKSCFYIDESYTSSILTLLQHESEFLVSQTLELLAKLINSSQNNNLMFFRSDILESILFLIDERENEKIILNGLQCIYGFSLFLTQSRLFQLTCCHETIGMLLKVLENENISVILKALEIINLFLLGGSNFANDAENPVANELRIHSLFPNFKELVECEHAEIKEKIIFLANLYFDDILLDI